MKRVLVGVLLISALTAGWFLFARQKVNGPPPKPTQSPEATSQPDPFTASFEIYTFGTKRDFSDKKYHNASVDAFIEDAPPYNVVVNKDGITWQEFFDTLPAPFKITLGCLYTGTGQEFCNSETANLYFTLNGEKDLSALQKQILKDDLLIIRFE